MGWYTHIYFPKINKKLILLNKNFTYSFLRIQFLTFLNIKFTKLRDPCVPQSIYTLNYH